MIANTSCKDRPRSSSIASPMWRHNYATLRRNLFVYLGHLSFGFFTFKNWIVKIVNFGRTHWEMVTACELFALHVGLFAATGFSNYVKSVRFYLQFMQGTSTVVRLSARTILSACARFGALTHFGQVCHSILLLNSRSCGQPNAEAV